MSTGERIKQARDQRGWSQRELARRAGIAQGGLSKLENGERLHGGSMEILQKIAAALDTPIDTLRDDTPTEDITQPPIELLKAAGLWTEAEERALRRAWPVLSPRRRTMQIARLQRLADTRAEYDRLYAEYQRSQQDEGTSANGVAPAVHVLGAL